jgi:uncharacterized protein YodC (DUF2158 family)
MTRSNLKVVPKDETEVEEVREPEFKDGDGGYVNGDTVMLKSGGPAMTVVGLDDGSGRITLAWFNEYELNSVELPAASVEPCDTEDEE